MIPPWACPPDLFAGAELLFLQAPSGVIHIVTPQWTRTLCGNYPYWWTIDVLTITPTPPTCPRCRTYLLTARRWQALRRALSPSQLQALRRDLIQ